MQQLHEAEHQRDVSLDFVSEQASKLAEVTVRAENAERELSNAAQRVNMADGTVESLERRLAQSNAERASAVAALAVERTVSQEAAERAAKAEASLQEAHAELERLRDEALIRERQRGELTTTLALKEEELSKLRSVLSATSSEASSVGAALANERASSTAELSRLKDNVTALTARLSAVITERDDALARTRDANARVSSLLVENGRLNEEVAVSRGQLTSFRTAHALKEASASVVWPGSVDSLSLSSGGSFSASSGAAASGPLSRSPLPPALPPALSSSSSSSLSPASAAAHALVRKTLAEAGLDTREADRWFAEKLAAGKAAKDTRDSYDDNGAEEEGVTSSSSGAALLLSPGAQALQQAIERTKAKRQQREAQAQQQQQQQAAPLPSSSTLSGEQVSEKQGAANENKNKR